MSDPFRYLETETSNESIGFYKKHNVRTDAYLAESKLEAYTDKLLEHSDADVRGLYRQYGEYLFWVERRRDWQKPKLLCRKRKSEPKVILDFNNSDESLDFWYPNDDGSIVLYGTSVSGNEQTTIRLIETVALKMLPDEISYAGFTDQGDICWLTGDSFIYPRMNGFSKTGPEDKWLLGSKLYLHKIGTDPQTDQLIFGKELPDTVMLTPTLSSNKSYLYVSVCEDELTHALARIELASLKAKSISIKSKSACYVKVGPGVVYIHTNYNAEKYRLITCEERSFSYNLDEWDEVLPESEDVLQGFWPHTSKNILALYSHKVSSRLRVFDQYGNQTATVETPKYSVISGVSMSLKSSVFYYSLSGFTIPSTIYKMSALESKPEVIWQRVKSQSDEYIVSEQYWAESKDGTLVPYFCIKHKDTKNNAPCVIYGYGGFNIALEPSYLNAARPWILDGGVYVLANLRGGSEFGEQWHKSGAMEHKQNTFDDCHAIAQDLIKRSVTSANKLGVLGGSNGGLLVAAVTLQRPDLYWAGASLVPLTDMIEFYKHQVAEFWVHEYGDPRIPEQLAWIMKWSPYHYPVDPDTTYPSLYYETALNDARVHPFHAFKMVAKLSDEVKQWKGPLLLRTLTDTGHQSSNKTKQEIARQTAEYYTFFARELGLTSL